VIFNRLTSLRFFLGLVWHPGCAVTGPWTSDRHPWRLSMRPWRWGMCRPRCARVRIARASGSPAGVISRARDLYLSALFRASSAGSLDGVLRIASALAELGDDEVVTHSLRIAPA
jgi:hypothetical protein